MGDSVALLRGRKERMHFDDVERWTLADMPCTLTKKPRYAARVQSLRS